MPKDGFGNESWTFTEKDKEGFDKEHASVTLTYQKMRELDVDDFLNLLWYLLCFRTYIKESDKFEIFKGIQELLEPDKYIGKVRYKDKK